MTETTLAFKDAQVARLHRELTLLRNGYRLEGDEAGVTYTSQFIEQVEDNREHEWAHLSGEIMLALIFTPEPDHTNVFSLSNPIRNLLEHLEFGWNTTQVADRPFATELAAMFRDTSVLLLEQGDEEGWQDLDFWALRVAGHSTFPDDMLVDKILGEIEIAELTHADANRAHLELARTITNKVYDLSGQKV